MPHPLSTAFKNVFNLPDRTKAAPLTLDDMIRRAVVSLYLADTGKNGNPPTKFEYWPRADHNIDARTALALEKKGLARGRAHQNGVPSDVQLTISGVDMAKNAIARV